LGKEEATVTQRNASVYNLTDFMRTRVYYRPFLKGDFVFSRRAILFYPYVKTHLRRIFK